MDVLPQEPPPKGHLLLGHPRALITPHGLGTHRRRDELRRAKPRRTSSTAAPGGRRRRRRGPLTQDEDHEPDDLYGAASVMLKVETDEGMTGWGEPVIEGRAATVAACVEELSDYLVGRTQPISRTCGR